MKLYHKYSWFRHTANFLGISFGASMFYGMTGGTCPCCGSPACPVGIASISFFGILMGGIVYIGVGIKKGGEKFRNLFFKASRGK